MDGGSWHCTGGNDQDHPKEKEMQKAKWLSEEAEKWREVKGKGEKEGYTHLNEEFQRTERRGKKDLLKDQCKEQRKTIEWERLEISSWKLRDTKGIFYAKMGTIKDRNVMDIMEAEDIKKRWQEYTEELYKKDFMTQTIMMV